MFKFACWVRLLVAALAMSRQTNWSLCCSCFSVGGVLDDWPLSLLGSDQLVPGWGVSVAVICWNGKDVEDNNEIKWEVLRKMIVQRSGNSWGIYSQLQVKMEWLTAKLANSTQDESATVSCRLQRFPTVVPFAPSQSDVVCFLTGINTCEWLLKSHVSEI